MKRKELFIVIICIIAHFCLLCLFGWLWNYDHPKKPDDEISEYIYNKIGHMFKYQGHNARYNGSIEYEYSAVITQEKIERFAAVIMNYSYGECEKLDFAITTEEIPGTLSGVCSFSNYTTHFKYDYKNENIIFTPDYDKPVVLIICDNPNLIASVEPSMFFGIKEIKYLIIPKSVQEKADEERIDWYEVWPELDGVEVF